MYTNVQANTPGIKRVSHAIQAWGGGGGKKNPLASKESMLMRSVLQENIFVPPAAALFLSAMFFELSIAKIMFSYRSCSLNLEYCICIFVKGRRSQETF